MDDATAWDSVKTTLSAFGTGLTSVMNNLGMQVDGFMTLITAFAYVAGIAFFALGIMMMTKAVNPQARTAYNGSAWFWSIAIGVLLFALPTTMAAISGTVFGSASPDPLAYSAVMNGNIDTGTCTLAGVRQLLMVIGFIACIRGLMVYRTVGMYGNYSRGNATVQRATVLCVSGIMLVNLKLTLALVNSVSPVQLGSSLC